MAWTSILIYMHWLTVLQYSYHTLSTRLFEHVHSSSLDFHLNQKPRAVTGALGKAVVIDRLLNLISFTIITVIFDLILVSDLSNSLMTYRVADTFMSILVRISASLHLRQWCYISLSPSRSPIGIPNWEESQMRKTLNKLASEMKVSQISRK